MFKEIGSCASRSSHRFTHEILRELKVKAQVVDEASSLVGELEGFQQELGSVEVINSPANQKQQQFHPWFKLEIPCNTLAIDSSDTRSSLVN